MGGRPSGGAPSSTCARLCWSYHLYQHGTFSIPLPHPHTPPHTHTNTHIHTRKSKQTVTPPHPLQLREIAPEYYNHLYQHRSWCWVIYQFLFNPRVGPWSRMRRVNKEGASPGAWGCGGGVHEERERERVLPRGRDWVGRRVRPCVPRFPRLHAAALQPISLSRTALLHHLTTSPPPTHTPVLQSLIHLSFIHSPIHPFMRPCVHALHLSHPFPHRPSRPAGSPESNKKYISSHCQYGVFAGSEKEARATAAAAAAAAAASPAKAAAANGNGKANGAVKRQVSSENTPLN